jgi:hypothetical protein
MMWVKVEETPGRMGLSQKWPSDSGSAGEQNNDRPIAADHSGRKTPAQKLRYISIACTACITATWQNRECAIVALIVPEAHDCDDGEAAGHQASPGPGRHSYGHLTGGHMR